VQFATVGANNQYMQALIPRQRTTLDEAFKNKKLKKINICSKNYGNFIIELL
jgi:hypothetical protein